jgi:hypothetical protein
MTHQSVHCTFSCILQIDTINTAPGDKFFSCNASILRSDNPDAVVDGMEIRDTMPVAITYYNVFEETFKEEAVIICIGTLCITEEAQGKSGDPLLAVRAHYIIRFDSNCRVTSLTIIR